MRFLGDKITHLATFEELEIMEDVDNQDGLFFEMIHEPDLLFEEE